MGLFSDDDEGTSDQQQQANALMQEQIQSNKAELEQKRLNLVQQRMAIIKSEGSVNWLADRSAPNAGMAKNSQSAPKLPFGIGGGSRIADLLLNK